MNKTEADAVSARAGAIRAAYHALESAREELVLVNKHARPGSHWKVTILLKKGEGYYGTHGEIKREVRVPAEWVIQDAINKVREAERAFIQAGGSYD